MKNLKLITSKTSETLKNPFARVVGRWGDVEGGGGGLVDRQLILSWNLWDSAALSEFYSGGRHPSRGAGDEWSRCLITTLFGLSKLFYASMNFFTRTE